MRDRDIPPIWRDIWRVEGGKFLQIPPFVGFATEPARTFMRTSQYTLSPTRINNAKPKPKQYKLSDGGGLYVQVSPAGLKTWRYQYRFGGARAEVTIGKYPEVGVADARDRHFECRSMLERGIDPAQAKRKELDERRQRVQENKKPENDFEAFSKRWVAERLKTKSATYRAQIESRLERFVWPEIGSLALGEVKPAHVLTSRRFAGPASV